MKEALPDIPWLELELPRSAALGGNGRTARVLAQLKERGFPLALDNYGCGHTEREGLAGLPIDKIKIDGSLARRLGKDPAAAQAIRQALEVRSSLAITLLAAGVETKDEYGLLTEWGCHLVQGNLLSPALPPERIAAAVIARPTDKEVEL
jgi:EAL domain-containing protein (putative c-di-GMP-specific phosphodiesterase class I)